MKLQLFLFVSIAICIVVNCDRVKHPKDIIDVPDNCPEGQHLSPDGECVDTWERKIHG